jgi:hypothetical protein
MHGIKNGGGPVKRKKGVQYFFPKIMPFMGECGKIWYSQTSHTLKYNMVHALGMLDN